MLRKDLKTLSIKKMTKIAVILAAGLGSRIKEFSSIKPKGFIEINGISLIERSINILTNAGISKIYIGTGYKSAFYDQLQSKYPCITTLKNVNFSNTGSFHTLYILNNLISENFILLESDLLYDKSVITTLLKEDDNDIIISSDFTNSGDEVYVIQEDNRLIKLTKSPDKSEIPDSEFVGISKISLSLYQKMCKNYEGIDSSKIEYEELFNNCAEENKIFIKNIKQLPWCEIDNKTHYKRALDVVSPKIIQNEKI